MKNAAKETLKSSSDGKPPIAVAAPALGWSRLRRFLVLSALLLLLLAAYANSFRVPFLLDDEGAITNNESIYNLSRVGWVLSPKPNTTVEGRPIANFSFAINYAISGTSVEGYHLGNFVIHAGAMLLLFGIVRRTLKRETRFANWAEWIACGVAGVWALHPIQTESVTYVVQRVESMMGFFYLLTLYAFMRSQDSARKSGGWKALAILSCWLGMGTKEVMVSAPLLVLLYDRTVIAGGFAVAWRARWRFYLGLFSSWLLLGWLLSSSMDRNSTAGFNVGVSPWHYLLTQCRAILVYLRQSMWPDNLVFDYGRPLVTDPSKVWVQATVLILLAGTTLWAIVRRSLVGVVGLWFFATLAPSSSIVPVATQTMTEHRMYLALAAVAAIVVVGAFRWLGPRALILYAVCLPALAVATFQRNHLYRDPLVIWGDTVSKMPGSARARNNLGHYLTRADRLDEAIAQFEEAVTHGDYSDAPLFTNYAFLAFRLERIDEAETYLKRAIEIQPNYYKAIALLGNVALKRGQFADAERLLLSALKIAPRDVTNRLNLGRAYRASGRIDETRREYLQVIAIDPSNVHAWLGLGELAFGAGDFGEAEHCYGHAIEGASKAEAATAHTSLADVYAVQNRLEDAEKEYAKAIESDPSHVPAYRNLATMLARSGKYIKAVSAFELALALAPNDADLLGGLAVTYQLLGEFRQAMDFYQRALVVDPTNAHARASLEQLQKRIGGPSIRK